MKMTFSGIKSMANRLAVAQARLSVNTSRALAREADAVFKESQLLVPEDTGELKDSGNVSAVALTSTMTGQPAFSVTITYGPLPHVLAVHEHPSSHSPPSWSGKAVNFRNGRGPKFLERPLFDRAQSMDSTVAKAVRL